MSSEISKAARRKNTITVWAIGGVALFFMLILMVTFFQGVMR